MKYPRRTTFLVLLSALGALLVFSAVVIPVQAQDLTPPSPTPFPSGASAEWPTVIPLIVSQPTPVGYGPEEFPPNINQLTGLQAEDPNLLERRPMVVKITNYPRTVRPQYGLSRADIVYEYYMERGISRFIAIFYGQQAEKVGPVRSGRFFDEHIFKMYDGFFVFGVADKRVMEYFLQLGDHWVKSLVVEDAESKTLDCNNGEPHFLCRDSSIISYNNMFTNTTALYEYVTRRNGNYRPDLHGMRFENRTPPGGEEAFNIFIRYSLFIYNKWAYLPQYGTYGRFQETIGYSTPDKESFAPHIDAINEEQITADNVVVLVVPHYYFVKTATTEIITIPLIDEGPAFFFRNGRSYEGRWERKQEVGVLQLFTQDGEPFPLKPGSTWFEVVSTDTSLARDYEDWRFYFNPPAVPEDLSSNPINEAGVDAPNGWFWDQIPQLWEMVGDIR